MRRFLSILCAFPLLAFGGVVCTVEQNVNGQVTIVCVDDSSGGGIADTNYFSEAACNELKRQMLSILDSVRDDLDLIRADLYKSGDWLDDMNIFLNGLRSSIQSYSSQLGQSAVDDLNVYIDQLFSRLSNIQSDYNLTQDRITGAQDNIDSKKAFVNAYDCGANSNLVCSGSGSSLSCPCQDQLLAILQAINDTKRELELQHIKVADINGKCTIMLSHFVTITNNWQELLTRLNSPDDRMWGEVMQIYTYLSSNMNETVNGSLNLYQIFEQIREKINDINDSTKMNLSTEGVIGLNNMVANMASLINNQYNNDMIWNAVREFTNHVTKLYKEYNSISKWSNSIIGSQPVPPTGKYSMIYSAFTNDNWNARGKFTYLGMPTYGGITNWFQRMELYQQAQLGWFENPVPDGELEKNNLQENNTHDILYSLNETTNAYGATIVALSNAYSKVEALYHPVLDSFEEINIDATLPSYITFLPEIEILNGATLGPVQLDTSEITEYIDVARNATTLFWKVSIWVLYILLGVGGTRLLFILVMFIVHIAKDL